MECVSSWCSIFLSLFTRNPLCANSLARLMKSTAEWSRGGYRNSDEQPGQLGKQAIFQTPQFSRLMLPDKALYVRAKLTQQVGLHVGEQRPAHATERRL